MTILNAKLNPWNNTELNFGKSWIDFFKKMWYNKYIVDFNVYYARIKGGESLEKKISQTELSSFKTGCFNVLMAPVGSGKTYYFGGKFSQDIQLQESKSILFLAPLKSIIQQSIDSQRMEGLTSKNDFLLNGFTIFQDNDSFDCSNLPKVIAMTIQKFTIELEKNPKILDKFQAIVVDEFDSILTTFQHLDEKMKRFFPLLERIYKTKPIYIVLTSATISDSNRIQLQKYKFNVIKTKDELVQIKPKFIKSFNDKKLFLQENPNNYKIAIYCGRVKTLLQIKQELEKSNYKVALLKSSSTSNQIYQMQSYDLKTLDCISKTGKVPKDLDFLLFNKAFERGVSIVDNSFRKLYIWSSNPIEQIQVSGRFRFDGIEIFEKGEIENKEIPKEEKIIEKYVEIELTSELKEQFAKELNWRNSSRRLLKWNSIKTKLENDYNYKIQNKTKTIEGKRQRISIISKS